MAFDGPTPFDGDPAYMYLEELEGTPEEIAAAITDAFEYLGSGEDYYEIDETVWAWACAELVALACGQPSDPAPPDPFAAAARKLPQPSRLVGPALAALEVVATESISEAAELWNESGDDTLAEHLRDLRERLGRAAH